MPDDLRDRLAAALRPFVDKGATWSKEPQAADAVLAVVQPELDKRDARIEDYRASRKRWMDAAFADRRDANAAVEARDRYRLAWQSARRRADCRTTDAQLEAERLTTRRVWDEYDAMKQRAEKAEAAVARVRLLHQRCTCRRELDLSLAPIVHCDCCDEDWPCSTIQILDRPELGAALAGPADAEQVPCSFATLARMHDGGPMPHAPHSWQPQPGMTPVWCPGPAGAGSTQDGA